MKLDNVPEYTWQVGVALPVANTVDAIEWKRKGYWSTYPANHLSANEGTAKRFSDIKETYRVQPNYDVAQGMYDYYLKNSIDPVKADMKGTEIYRATKENILTMDLISGNKKIEVSSNGLQAAKMNILESGQQELLIMDKWDYWSLSLGEFCRNQKQFKK